MRSTNQLSWQSPYTILTLILGIALVFLGANFMIQPHEGATGYGLTVGSIDADGLLRAKGLRDLVAGLFFFCLVTFSSTRTVALFMMTSTLIPYGDALIVAMTPGAPAYAVPMHAGTATFMLILSVLMLRRASRSVGVAGTAGAVSA
ncbi:DUF4267 domain-containing protein [Duganella sp. FT135W]|uniref:DUF4267 domain-containing protein n=1 Tax=Duganella flavida TaxID=2692175 RepID=A0A6L8KFR2_9BURK|nr:DUF4267 domain-containing protein [Duganella flavida]MYM26283.1 DUF4267 domain-containing protein [Duganella flavida]